jgi:hypothetical protein
MTPLTSIYKSFSILLVLFLVSVPIFVSQSVSSSGTTRLSQRTIRSKTNTNFIQHSQILKGKVVLEKDESLTINNCRLVFRGVEDKIIHLDLYLLELDPEYPYPQHISKAAALEGIRMGDSEFQLISVDKKTLKLKINSLFKAS